MSKIKDEMMRQQDETMKEAVAYQEMLLDAYIKGYKDGFNSGWDECSTAFGIKSLCATCKSYDYGEQYCTVLDAYLTNYQECGAYEQKETADFQGLLELQKEFQLYKLTTAIEKLNT